MATLTINHHDSEWIADTEATSHMTNDPGKLSNLRQYSGSDEVVIGNGETLAITHLGDTSIGNTGPSLHLKNVLLVPSLSRNLLSVSQLTTEYLVTCEFTNTAFEIKDRTLTKTLMKGSRKGNLYMLSTPHKVHFSNRSNCVSEDIWHARLGHPQAATTEALHSQGLIQISTKSMTQSLCESCQLGKSSKLPFVSS